MPTSNCHGVLHLRYTSPLETLLASSPGGPEGKYYWAPGYGGDVIGGGGTSACQRMINSIPPHNRRTRTHTHTQLLWIPCLTILLLFFRLFSWLTVGSLMNTRAPTIRAFSHANLVGCTVSVSRLMSRRSLRTGASIFQIYLSTGRIFVPKAFWFLAMRRILFFVLHLPWSPWFRIPLLPHLIRLQVSSVQSTSIGTALPLSFKLLRYHILIGNFGSKVTTKKR